MKRALPILAFLGALIAVGAVVAGEVAQVGPKAITVAPRSPFASFVAGPGVLEPRTQAIAIGAPVSGIVSEVCVQWGDRVKPGDPLVRLDDRDLQARLATELAAEKVSLAELERAEHHLAFVSGLEESVSRREMATRKDDVNVQRATRALAEAKVAEVRAEIERRTVRAPLAGRILSVNVRPGELVGDKQAPLLLLGDDDRLHVRVEIDEHDAWRVKPGAKAVALVRGNVELRIPLEFVRIEPLVAPKTVLSGRGTERTDSRVLPVVYGFDRGSWPVYSGQQVDVTIEAAPLALEPR